jgi:hypothetical protein
MSHPSSAFPKGFHFASTGYIDPQVGQYFTSVLCLTDGEVWVFGGGMYANNVSTEREYTVLDLKAGMIVYGRFTRLYVPSESTGEFLAYYA